MAQARGSSRHPCKVGYQAIEGGWVVRLLKRQVGLQLQAGGAIRRGLVDRGSEPSSTGPSGLYNPPVPTGPIFVFESFELDPGRRRLSASGEPVAISDRQFDILCLFVARAGQIVSKDELLQAAWKDVAVSDNSIEQAISSLRRLLGVRSSRLPYIETVPRRGYRFVITVTRTAMRESDAALDALLAPQRAFIDGRAALETLEVRAGPCRAGARLHHAV